jgi:hypothetical protein
MYITNKNFIMIVNDKQIKTMCNLADYKFEYLSYSKTHIIMSKEFKEMTVEAHIDKNGRVNKKNVNSFIELILELKPLEKISILPSAMSKQDFKVN